MLQITRPQPVWPLPFLTLGLSAKIRPWARPGVQYTSQNPDFISGSSSWPFYCCSATGSVQWRSAFIYDSSLVWQESQRLLAGRSTTPVENIQHRAKDSFMLPFIISTFMDQMYLNQNTDNVFGPVTMTNPLTGPRNSTGWVFIC